jgi:hypothetical protein
VSTSFRKRGDSVGEATDEEVQNYEKAEEQKRTAAVAFVLIALGAVVLVVLCIFVYQSRHANHQRVEFEKRAKIYKKESAHIRETLKRRQSTMKLPQRPDGERVRLVGSQKAPQTTYPALGAGGAGGSVGGGIQQQASAGPSGGAGFAAASVGGGTFAGA